uniref:Uncharacterized protein n=1 Tax=Anguilla anguilla TaxID=7936 RepID=A0A0E9W8L6_ANGAN
MTALFIYMPILQYLQKNLAIQQNKKQLKH